MVAPRQNFPSVAALPHRYKLQTLRRCSSCYNCEAKTRGIQMIAEKERETRKLQKLNFKLTLQPQKWPYKKS